MKAADSRQTLYQPLAEINVTPLVDVMLVLLIVFMITAPMLAAGMKVELPQAKSAQPVDPKEPTVITIGKDGRVFLGRGELERGHVVDALRAKLGSDKERAIHLRGDRDVVYGDVVAVMDQLAAGGFTKIVLIANARSGEAARVQASPPATDKPD